jgi:hypothetical protein
MTGGVEYLRIAEGEPLPDIASCRPFKAVVVADAACSYAWRAEVSRWLVESGCLYMMAWGIESVEWHDAVDWALLERCPDRMPTDEEHVMTTWHEDEPLKEVFWFDRICASHPVADLRRGFIIHVSATSAREDMLALHAAAGDPDYLPD